MKIRKSTKWPSGGGAFSDQGERNLPGGSVLNAFPPSDGLTKRRKCSSAAAASSGLALVQDRANVVKAARRQRAFTWLFGLLHSKACLCICARLIMRHLGWHQILFISLLVDRSCAAYCPDFTYSQAAPRALPAALGVVHASSRRFVLQTCHSCAERKRSRRLGFGSARLDSKFRRAQWLSVRPVCTQKRSTRLHWSMHYSHRIRNQAG